MTDTFDFSSMGDLPTPDPDGADNLAKEQISVQLQPGDVVANRFEVVRQLGAGGMGAVYHVKDRDLKEDRAMKVMLPSLLESQSAQDRFLEEIKISQKLSNDYIVRVHDLIKDDTRNIQVFTMELVNGVTLSDRMSAGNFELDEMLDLMRQLCEGMAYAHQYSVHRDLKPQNIMIQPNRKIKILDFGLAKLMGTEQSRAVLGTPYYLSPEQLESPGDVDHRSDIYSLGVVFYQILTGELIMGMAEPVSTLNPKVPAYIDGIVSKCLARKKENRYHDVNELLDALNQGAALTSNDAHEKNTPPKPSGFPTKAIAALVVLIVVAGSGFWYTQQDGEEPEPTSELTKAPDPSPTGDTPVDPTIPPTATPEETVPPTTPPAETPEERAKRLEEEAMAQAERDRLAAEAKAEKDRLAAEAIAKKNRNSAKTIATALRIQIGPMEKKRGKAQVDKAETAWAAAEASGEDYALGTLEYNTAATSFTNAIELGRGPATGTTKTFDNIEFVWVRRGSATLGRPESDPASNADETPYKATISKGYWIGRYEVTQAQWERVMTSNPSQFKATDKPVDNVSWEDAQRFIDKLNGSRSLYRLPTEAEWEFALRAGNTASDDFGDRNQKLDSIGWYSGNTDFGSNKVGQKKPNAWGLYDMRGNVWEWCSDWYSKYPSTPQSNPAGPSRGDGRVLRGGSWESDAKACRWSARNNAAPMDQHYTYGFRIIRSEL